MGQAPFTQALEGVRWPLPALERMNRRTRLTSLAAATALAALLLAGCGGTPEVETPADGGTETGQTAESDGGEDKVDDAAEGTRENPYPIGSVIKGDEWTITVNNVNLDANEAVADENEFNEPPSDGNVFILVNVTAEYTGDDSQGSTPWVTVEYVTVDGNTIATHDDETMMTVAPDALDTLTTLYSGASISGNLVLSVPADTAADGVLAVTPDLLSDKVFVAVT